MEYLILLPEYLWAPSLWWYGEMALQPLQPLHVRNHSPFWHASEITAVTEF
jgi:hypothetical protein